MDTAEVIEAEPDDNGCPVVLPFLAEAIGDVAYIAVMRDDDSRVPRIMKSASPPSEVVAGQRFLIAYESKQLVMYRLLPD